MKVKVIRKGEVEIVRVDGAIKSGDEYTLAEIIENHIKPNCAPKFILDLKKVPFANSAALGIFVNVYKHVDGLNGRVVFAHLNAEVTRIMEITRLSSIFEIFRNAEEALESFNF